jgi:ribosomal protein S12 methylthiotransferase accessory factor
VTVKGSAAKKFRRGTHRIVSPASTIKRFGPQARAFGITRLANVTGLDYLGVPVFMAMRPNAKSLSVSQGKGLDADAAMASALMEAIELAHAEDFSSAQSRTANYAALRRHAADPALLPRLTTASLTSDMRLRWTLGVDLMNGNATWVPFDLVHTDFTLRYRGPFFRSSNGLASGNHLLEAQCAALCEVIERDATALFHLLGAKARAARRVRPQSVRNPDCRRLLAQLEARGIAVALWNATSDIGVPCFICRFDEAIGNDRSAIGASWGAGCHLNRDVAMVRAITEAAQSRLTMIAGSRDDLLADDYGDGDGTSLFDVALDAWERHLAGSRAADIRSLDTPTFEGDRDVLLSRLRAAGVGQAIAIDLSQERFGIPVVRVIVPDLAVHDRHGRVRAVPRERAMAKACAA